ncbi:MAG: Protein phosphatase PP2A regulatory subunit B [Chaenotheca gracillima]|nr:MAG: Protein phosphatase PP2A regulatory subunit B [Chaenotheca gracillima]
MYQSFTGNARRSRQVNLSGRNANPFGASAPATRPSAASAGTQNTLANAQQERLSRQRERDRLDAARNLQRIWRGCAAREGIKADFRRQWDELEGFHAEMFSSSGRGMTDSGAESTPSPFPSPAKGMLEMRLLPHFFDPVSEDDLRRLDLSTSKLLQSHREGSIDLRGARWQDTLWRLGRLSLRALGSDKISPVMVDRQLGLLAILVDTIPTQMAQISGLYYQTLASLINHDRKHTFLLPSRTSALLEAVLRPLQAPQPSAQLGYEGLTSCFLTTPNLQTRFTDFDLLLSTLNFHALCGALITVLEASKTGTQKDHIDQEGRLWLLAYFIHFQSLSTEAAKSSSTPDIDYVNVVSDLLRSLAEEISKRLDVEDFHMETRSDGQTASKGSTTHAPLPPFVREQLLSLVNQESVTRLLHYADTLADNGLASGSLDLGRKSRSRLLASYALTLLRIFPRKADEIRMWLYLGSVNVTSPSSTNVDTRLPTVKFFWQASRRTEVFRLISSDPLAAVSLLRPEVSPTTRREQQIAQSLDPDVRDQEWRIILIFFELYSFVLKVMDDEEFFSAKSMETGELLPRSSSWTKKSALPLGEVQDLTVFLKNLGFTLHWNASNLVGMNATPTTDDIRTYFNSERARGLDVPQKEESESKTPSTTVAGVTGMTVEYVKGIVTGLLRMIYERDSRRRFLPKDHWLMTGRFDMEAFIPAVVSEEENRHRIQEAEENDSEDDERLSDEDMPSSSGLVGTQRARRTQNLERLRKQQLKASRKKYLEAITPRLEILQNMPFFIPFATRVQIFRRFVYWDQHRRRGGFIDPDQWRMSIMGASRFAPMEERSPGQDIISRHHAKIRREELFDDAFEQFYSLGDSLKEPIQITFVDRFDTVEAGIDGGGVTKEFLTSVTNEAFSPSKGLDLFVENDQNLLFPNPAAVDERKDLLKQAGIAENSPEWNESVRDLLRRYEFLGRVIGKCLYEGILVDVGFAPHFLLKWALTGGSKAASRESSYRANLNDLRDLDEALYQGLLQLKNYPGNVEDFSLNFTITDTISTPRRTEDGHEAPSTRTITRDLRPNGSNIPVTNENRLFYISYVARHRLQVQPRAQTNAFLRGLGEIIQPEWLAMFNQSELQTLVGGDASEIDVDDLRRNTLYGGVYTIGDDNQEHPSVQLFWSVMRALSDLDRRKVLKFVTSTPRGPLLGFGQLNPRFSIRDAGADQERLPSTSTCVNLLKLPRYHSAQILQEKLLYAVNSGAGFDLS